MSSVAPIAVKRVQNWTTRRMAESLNLRVPLDNTDPGALFLRAVRDDTLAALSELGKEWPSEHHMVEHIANGVIDYDTHARWLEYVDLGAYRMPVLGGITDMSDVATRTLRTIAELLAWMIVAEVDAPQN
ncbi:hypothetical protein Lfu02_55090 [Longispora fulva]|uniref:Uncharacterized protein n=1 Tax=Longispora fulva TaxID=619741 RepID=A0A8J7GJ16_9ACTN|nr:hypothetical protein [Longispora fulva]MBG6137510.1 hypothetical protein [Longispora fulva]GIG61137.1 hypothetical protein Lfu02_55090 [Longispora fulva]